MTGDSLQVRKAVDDWFASDAKHWDDLYGRTSLAGRIYQRRQDLAMRWVDGLELDAGASVLEIGCGAGHATVALARKGFNVTATDPVPAMLRLTYSRARAAGVGEAVKLTYADAHALAFSERVFQLIIGLGVIPWLYSPAQALAEIARVLQPGGFLIVSADNRMRLTHVIDPRLNPFLAPARSYLRQLAGFARPSRVGVPRMHSSGQMRTLLEAAGFTLLADSTCGFGPFTAFGHSVLSDSIGVRLDSWLQGGADAGLPILKRIGAHYVTLCWVRR